MRYENDSMQGHHVCNLRGFWGCHVDLDLRGVGPLNPAVEDLVCSFFADWSRICQRYSLVVVVGLAWLSGSVNPVSYLEKISRDFLLRGCSVWFHGIKPSIGREGCHHSPECPFCCGSETQTKGCTRSLMPVEGAGEIQPYQDTLLN